jgi:hypothetical protein
MTREDAKAILEDCLYKAEYKYGAYGIALKMAIKALEQKDWKFYYDHGYAQAKRDLQEPKTGHWEMCEDADGIYGVCDICGTDADFTHYGKAYPYCPNCGARMESEDKECI